jgi:hypothetical protein
MITRRLRSRPATEAISGFSGNDLTQAHLGYYQFAGKL